jgi:putative tricarboxylic transport membrane protein
MSDRDTPTHHEPDILAELEAEVAQELADQRPPVGGPAYQLVSAAVVLVIGVGAAVLAHGYGLGSLKRPGPGLWPFVVSIVIVCLAAVLLVIGRRLDDDEKFTKASVLALVGGATFVGLAVLMPTIGFEIPAIALCIVWLRFLGGETWRSTIVISLCTTAAFYLLFLYGLRISLPHLLVF